MFVEKADLLEVARLVGQRESDLAEQSLDPAPQSPRSVPGAGTIPQITTATLAFPVHLDWRPQGLPEPSSQP